ncbi:DUF262 domain-containing protein [Eubacterium oxidoreducens]|uniref:GmrSD restriction endonucleases N-terminal domain-containing protein n=1 Tax=Eubacterium oxidoreducens TaxID=1732 RepID=A0A1G6B2Z5_EUBOX|nr:DUF262 domain-containing protein [Eubacterium oxidoreducens]SDB14823.1 Protein of unknown function DUF262 [Eubacterium oxidoreducens]
MNKNSRPWTVKQITKMIDNGSLVFDNAVQRTFVWNKNRMCLFIDSILRDYPVPAFYAITDGRKITTPKGEVSVYDCLDGKQRCTTLHMFINNEFVLQGLEPFKTNEGEVDVNGMTYEQLPEELQDAFKNFHMNAYSFDDATDEDVVEIMARLNNGKPLSAIDNTRIKAKDLAGIKRLAFHKLFTEFLTEKAIARRQNEEIVVKTYLHLANPESGLDNKDIRPVYETLEVSPDVEKMLTERFDYLYDVVAEMTRKGEKLTKKAVKTILKKTHMVSVMYIIDRAVKEGVPFEDVIKCLTQFYDEGKPSSDERYNEACSNGSNHAGNVIARREALKKQYDWFFN